VPRTVRAELHRWIYHTFGEVARTINPVVAGWMQYYGRFYPSGVYCLLARINAYLVLWIRNKYQRYDKTRAAAGSSRRSPPDIHGCSGTGAGSRPPTDPG